MYAAVVNIMNVNCFFFTGRASEIGNSFLNIFHTTASYFFHKSRPGGQKPFLPKEVNILFGCLISQW